ncbi:hypothetical protein [Sporosarcina limicola]|uniref:Uncharacterized protein n=1 Tax=Sporosarcina limicola TaxID=34101 RepID=A0A927MLN6_9BACL|nr:hypothetical protein [Sporosarcina limicola]MBE1556236.1 hypothetical protein [Sporosarcina limicola]
MKHEKKVEEMLATLDFKITELEREMPNPNRIALSKIRDTKEWIPLLDKYNTIEVISGVETIAQINAPDLVPHLIQKIKQLQKELTNAQLNGLYGDRAHEVQPLSGEKLAITATDYLDELLKIKGSKVDDR